MRRRLQPRPREELVRAESGHDAEAPEELRPAESRQAHGFLDVDAVVRLGDEIMNGGDQPLLDRFQFAVMLHRIFVQVAQHIDQMHELARLPSGEPSFALLHRRHRRAGSLLRETGGGRDPRLAVGHIERREQQVALGNFVDDGRLEINENVLARTPRILGKDPMGVERLAYEHVARIGLVVHAVEPIDGRMFDDDANLEHLMNMAIMVVRLAVCAFHSQFALYSYVIVIDHRMSLLHDVRFYYFVIRGTK